MRNILAMTFVTALLAGLLTGCTIYVDPYPYQISIRGRVHLGVELADIITSFAPTRGQGATYDVGETISFSVRTKQDGYISLSAIDPDGSVYNLTTNIYVRAFETALIPDTNARYTFSLVPPRGLHRVRAVFTPSPISGSIRYRGLFGDEAWTQSIVLELSSYPSTSRDAWETYFYLR